MGLSRGADRLGSIGIFIEIFTAPLTIYKKNRQGGHEKVRKTVFSWHSLSFLLINGFP